MANGFLPEDRTRLATQPIPTLLVIIHDGTKKIALQLLKGHCSRLSRRFGIVHAVTGIGQTSRDSLGHPAKKQFDSPLGGRTLGRCLFGDDAQLIHQHMPCSLGRKNFPAIMKDDRWLAETGPGVLTPCLEDQTILGFQCPLDESHVIFFASVVPTPARHS